MKKAIYEATDEYYRDFLFAAIHTGLRPFCELAKTQSGNTSRKLRAECCGDLFIEN